MRKGGGGEASKAFVKVRNAEEEERERERKKRTRGQSGRKEKKEDGWRRIGGSVEQVEIKVATPKPDAENPCDARQDFRRGGRGMEHLPTYHLSLS